MLCPFCNAEIPEPMVAEIEAVSASCPSGCDAVLYVAARCPACQRVFWRREAAEGYDALEFTALEVEERREYEEEVGEDINIHFDLAALALIRARQLWAETPTLDVAAQIIYFADRPLAASIMAVIKATESETMPMFKAMMAQNKINAVRGNIAARWPELCDGLVTSPAIGAMPRRG
jgi:hypothetical protein